MTRMVQIFAALIVIGFLVWLVVPSEEIGFQRAIVDEVSCLVGDCREIGEHPITVKGKCLIWNMSNNYRSNVCNRLPKEILGCSSDCELTVFMVMPIRKEIVGHMVQTRRPIYRRYVDIYVAYWPEKEPAGLHTLEWNDTVQPHQVRFNPDYLESFDRPLAEWIKGLPRSG